MSADGPTVDRCVGFNADGNSQFCVHCGRVQQAHNTCVTPASPEPAVWQRWADCDKRSATMQREVVIVEIRNYLDGWFARCQVWKNGAYTGREVGIALKRFKPTATGYRFIWMEPS